MRRTEITQTFPVAGTGLLQARVALYPMMIGVRITSRQCRDERRAIVGGWVGLWYPQIPQPALRAVIATAKVSLILKELSGTTTKVRPSPLN